MSSSDGTVRPDFESVFRAEYGRTVAALIRRFGFEVAEDAVGEALVVALERWPVEGVPPNPGGWLTTTAHRKALDRLRRSEVGSRKESEASYLGSLPVEPLPDDGVVEDDRLRLVFTCCHPALALEARVALTLRLVGGLTVQEIARAFLVPERTLAQRITRAKKKIADAHIPYRVPSAEDLPGRLAGVLHVLYLVFNEGYLATAGSDVRDELALEAVRLTRVLHSLVPAEPEVTGLLALQLLTLARRPARVVDGALVPLDAQDRSRWDAALIAEGHALVRSCLEIGQPGPFQIQAAVAAVHTDAATFADTDWSQIVALYDQLLVVAPSPVVALNRAVAVGELDGPVVALRLVDSLELTDYADWHATRGELLRRLGRASEAASALERAAELTANEAQGTFLARRLAALPE
ncbi:RNA polymerase sigma factor [Spongisporangium articulatum]|uniref:RNA polymerase sigma factor n=1 Tax=Spongisporangium articulatum TaxID=3362603 RepID=A0ABW8AI99_9ACTN